jgi:hypothetical protein
MPEWERDKPKQAFPPQNLRKGCFKPTTWCETALTTAPGLPFFNNNNYAPQIIITLHKYVLLQF